MAGRRRRGNAAAGAMDLVTELLYEDRKFQREAKLRAIEMERKFEQDKWLMDRKAYLEGFGEYDAAGQLVRKPAEAPQASLGGLPLYEATDPVTGAKYRRSSTESTDPLMNPQLQAAAREIFARSENMPWKEAQRQAAESMGVEVPYGNEEVVAPEGSGFWGNIGMFGPPGIDIASKLGQGGLPQVGKNLSKMASEAVSGKLRRPTQQPIMESLNWEDEGLPDPATKPEGHVFEDADTGEVFKVQSGAWIRIQ